mgnify:CR=1 FL=1
MIIAGITINVGSNTMLDIKIPIIIGNKKLIPSLKKPLNVIFLPFLNGQSISFLISNI